MFLNKLEPVCVSVYLYEEQAWTNTSLYPVILRICEQRTKMDKRTILRYTFVYLSSSYLLITYSIYPCITDWWTALMTNAAFSFLVSLSSSVPLFLQYIQPLSWQGAWHFINQVIHLIHLVIHFSVRCAIAFNVNRLYAWTSSFFGQGLEWC